MPFNIVPIWRYLAERPIVRMVLQRAGEAAWMREDRGVMASFAQSKQQQALIEERNARTSFLVRILF